MTMSTGPPIDDAPYDDDDLINDYMEDDDFGPPMDDYEAYVEDMMDDEPQDSKTDGKQFQPDQTTKQVSNLKSNGDIAMEGTDHDVPIEVTVDDNSLRKDNESKLYSFERYNDTYEWRKKSSQLKREEEEIMAATQWKQKMSEQNELEVAQRKKSNAPESQLVEFLNDIIIGGMKSKNCFVDANLMSEKSRYKVSSNLPIENEQSIPITVEGGKMIYVPKVKDDLNFLRCDKVATVNDSTAGLLGIPLIELIKRTEALERRNDRRKRIRKEKEIDEAFVSHETNDEHLDNDSMNIDEMNSSEVKKTKYNTNSQLWVDKYAPITFSDLLSDERTNREVLRALRQWDPFVFQKAPPARPQSYSKYADNKSNQNNSSSSQTENEVTDAQKDDLRPDEQSRVILLSGAPGVGKTTLAHIVARHAGYRPVEVNASDERSSSVLTDRVSRAMESTTLNLTQMTGKDDNMNGRPNCLILDEIDGADAKASISALVEIIRAERPVKGNKNKSKKMYLRRPIIFICNHKYAPALRPLLPFARQFDVLPPSSTRLVSRLKAVLGSEKMTVISGSSLLQQLVASSGGDIRSCLFTLQFASARAKEIFHKKKKQEGIAGDFHNSVIDVSPVLNIALNGSGKGTKDIRGDISATLQAVFKKLKLKTVAGSSNMITSSRDVERVLNVIDTFSDTSKTLDAMFLNLLNVSYIDPTLDRCWTAHEWLSSVDIYRSYKTSVASTNNAEHRNIQQFYIPSAAAAVHILCRVETSPELTYTLRPLLDALHRLEVNGGLVNKFLEGLNPKARSGISAQGFTSEVLPFCLSLLSAGGGLGALTRPVSSIEFLTKEERLTFDEHVEILRALGLTYKKVEDGLNLGTEIEMRLEPEIDKVLQFQRFHARRQHVSIPSTLKELLAHSANIAYWRSKDEQSQNSNEVRNTTSNIVETSTKETSAFKTNDSIVLKEDILKLEKKDKPIVGINFLGIGAAKAKAARNARKAAQIGVDRTKKSAKKYSNTGSGVPIEEVIRFKYQKGFTQAVRLPCSKSDFTII